jgi:hypothetical protein
MACIEPPSSDETASAPSSNSFPPSFKRDIPGECKFCRKIIDVIDKEVSEIRDHISADIGPIDEILSSECNQHKDLLEHFSEELKLKKEKGTLSIFREFFSSSFWFYHATNSQDHGASTPKLDVLGGGGLGLPLSSSSISEETLSRWYEDCTSGHGEKCSLPKYFQYLPPCQPEYFVDIIDNCLVPAPSNVSYAALSYVWGGIKMFSTESHNVLDLQKPGAFEDPNIMPHLPKTVRQAMYLTKTLNIRYLWVDALCIVQDNNQTVYRHLPQMGSIYAHASIVIISIDGDNASFGLCGLRGAPEALTRQVKQSIIPFGKRSIVTRHDMGREFLTGESTKPYFGRGWTFQEFFFSRRRICFENDSVWFQCCSSTRYEDHKKPHLPLKEREWMLDVGYPSITVYSRIVGEFNRRYLRFPQDCLLAFAGVLPCYSKVFTGGFVCGLPEMFFDAMLLWQPGGHLVRRKSAKNDRTPTNTSHDICLPSWSWVGWHGNLNFRGWDTANDFVANCSGWIGLSRCRTVSNTAWYVSKTPSGTDRRKVHCLWSEWRERYRDPSVELPEGWTKRLRSEGETFTSKHCPENYGKYVYEFKGLGSPSFWYPLPLSDAAEKLGTDANAAYLCAELQAAYAYIFNGVSIGEDTSGFSISKYPYVSLSNADRKWIGMLRLPSIDCLETMKVCSEKGGHKIELIAISEGYVPK